MQLRDYVNLLKTEYNAKLIDFNTEVKNYFSSPDTYGENLDIQQISEGEICSNRFITCIIDGFAVDALGKFDWGTKAIIVFVAFDEKDEVCKYCVISSFRSNNEQNIKKLYRILEIYR